MYKTVYDLSEQERNELKSVYYYQLMDDDADLLEGIDYPEEIPDETIFEHYEGICFTDDDFFCNLNH